MWFRREPVPPKNARLTCEDGTVIPLDFVYAGRHGRLYQWVSARPIVIPMASWELTVDVMPPRTELLLGLDVIGYHE